MPRYAGKFNPDESGRDKCGPEEYRPDECQMALLGEKVSYPHSRLAIAKGIMGARHLLIGSVIIK